MKRILFYSENFCGEESQGGLEVATFRIASALKDSGKWEVFNAFRSKWDGRNKSVYKDVIKLSKNSRSFEKSLETFIQDNRIDVVVNMTRFFRHHSIYKVIKKSERDVKLIFMQHFAPGSEFKKGTYKSGLHLLKLNPWNPSYWIRTSVYPLIKYPRNKRLGGVYRNTYLESDKVILLSEGYKSDYCLVGGFSETSKFVAIPNIFEIEPSDKEKTTKELSADEIILKKEKRVLILSRMDEIQKRISIALKIWKEIENDMDLSDWCLDIVGAGHNTDIVKRLIKNLSLERVNYYGWQPREKYLQKSSIMLSTSEYEGLPLALLEAQAYGAVPIAFDSYASLKDVVVPYENGVLVEKFGDIEGFVEKLKDLMIDEEYRKELAFNAMNSSNRFSSKKIAEKWLNVLDEL